MRMKIGRLKILKRLPHATIKLGPGPIKGWDQQGPFDIAAAGRALDYKPLWSLNDGIDDLLEYHKSCVMIG